MLDSGLGRGSWWSPARLPALRLAAGQALCNTSRFTLRDLHSRASQQQLRALVYNATRYSMIT